MKVLVEDLLLLARLDETRPSASDPVDLTILAADACSDAVATAPDRQVTLEAPAPVVVQGDADHLRQAIANLKTRGAIVVLIAHRPSVLAVCDHILVLANGEQKDFGTRDEIMQKMTRPVAAPAAAGNLKVVSGTTAGG